MDYVAGGLANICSALQAFVPSGEEGLRRSAMHISKMNSEAGCGLELLISGTSVMSLQVPQLHMMPRSIFSSKEK